MLVTRDCPSEATTHLVVLFNKKVMEVIFLEDVKGIKDQSIKYELIKMFPQYPSNVVRSIKRRSYEPHHQRVVQNCSSNSYLLYKVYGGWHGLKNYIKINPASLATSKEFVETHPNYKNKLIELENNINDILNKGTNSDFLNYYRGGTEQQDSIPKLVNESHYCVHNENDWYNAMNNALYRLKESGKEIKGVEIKSVYKGQGYYEFLIIYGEIHQSFMPMKLLSKAKQIRYVDTDFKVKMQPDWFNGAESLVKVLFKTGELKWYYLNIHEMAAEFVKDHNVDGPIKAVCTHRLLGLFDGGGAITLRNHQGKDLIMRFKLGILSTKAGKIYSRLINLRGIEYEEVIKKYENKLIHSIPFEIPK